MSNPLLIRVTKKESTPQRERSVAQPSASFKQDKKKTRGNAENPPAKEDGKFTPFGHLCRHLYSDSTNTSLEAQDLPTATQGFHRCSWRAGDLNPALDSSVMVNEDNMMGISKDGSKHALHSNCPSRDGKGCDKGDRCPRGLLTKGICRQFAEWGFCPRNAKIAAGIKNDRAGIRLDPCNRVHGCFLRCEDGVRFIYNFIGEDGNILEIATRSIMATYTVHDLVAAAKASGDERRARHNEVQRRYQANQDQRRLEDTRKATNRKVEFLRKVNQADQTDYKAQQIQRRKDERTEEIKLEQELKSCELRLKKNPEDADAKAALAALKKKARARVLEGLGEQAQQREQATGQDELDRKRKRDEEAERTLKNLLRM